MFVRLAMEDEMDAVVEMGRANTEETRPDLVFDREKAEATFLAYIDTANPTIWVAEHDRQPIAFLLASMYEYEAAHGLFTIQRVLYVKPDHRGTRAALLLMKHFIAWSKMLGAKEIIGGNDNSFNSERTARFLEHLGFERVGYSMRLLLDGRQ